MPSKYAEKKGCKVPKQKYNVSNWSEYNAAIRQQNSIEVWISQDIATKWYKLIASMMVQGHLRCLLTLL